MTQKYTAQSISRGEMERKKTITQGIWTGTWIERDRAELDLINDIYGNQGTLTTHAHVHVLSRDKPGATAK